MSKANVPQMNEEERNEVCGKLEWEGGYDYFIDGSDFPEIKDKRFHELREAFVKAAEALEQYLRFEEYLKQFEVEDE